MWRSGDAQIGIHKPNGSASRPEHREAWPAALMEPGGRAEDSGALRMDAVREALPQALWKMNHSGR
jgi:hypothetical protein